MLKFDGRGLIPAIAQDADSGEVLMLAYVDGEALRRTLETGEAWFWSRSRRELWHKGETSGSTLQVQSVLLDCDGDALLLKVKPAGPVCHTGNRSCFFTGVSRQDLGDEELPQAREGPGILEELFGVIRERQANPVAGSRTAALLQGGLDRIGKKVVEEAFEAVLAAKNGEPGPLAGEMADLFYHVLVLLAAAGSTPEAVWQELRRRRGRGRPPGASPVGGKDSFPRPGG